MRALSLFADSLPDVGFVPSLPPVLRWIEVARERAALRGLDDTMLADIGLDRAAAEAEAQRPFWDLPERR